MTTDQHHPADPDEPATEPTRPRATPIRVPIRADARMWPHRRETVEVSDAEVAGHWDDRLWNPAP